MIYTKPLNPSEFIPLILPHQILPNPVFCTESRHVFVYPRNKYSISCSSIPMLIEIVACTSSVKPQCCLQAGTNCSVSCVLVPFPVFFTQTQLPGKPDAGRLRMNHPRNKQTKKSRVKFSHAAKFSKLQLLFRLNLVILLPAFSWRRTHQQLVSQFIIGDFFGLPVEFKRGIQHLCKNTEAEDLAERTRNFKR